MPLFGPPNIEKLKEKRDVDALIKALSDKSRAVRGAAAEALGELGDPRAIHPLVAALADREKTQELNYAADLYVDVYPVRDAATKALERIGGPKALRLARQLVEAETEAARLGAKLDSHRFRENAPPHLVASEQERLTTVRARVEELRRALAQSRGRQR